MSRIFDCPGCGADRLDAVSDGERTNFFCEACHRCWFLELGWLRAVDPETCPGCDRRAECAGWAKTHALASS